MPPLFLSLSTDVSAYCEPSKGIAVGSLRDVALCMKLYSTPFVGASVSAKRSVILLDSCNPRRLTHARSTCQGSFLLMFDARCFHLQMR